MLKTEVFMEFQLTAFRHSELSARRSLAVLRDFFQQKEHRQDSNGPPTPTKRGKS
jgi:hypothetical protein